MQTTINTSYGSITVDLETLKITDTLDRVYIWNRAGHDYTAQQDIYMSLLGDVIVELEAGENYFFGVEYVYRDFGAEVYHEPLSVHIILDAEGSWIEEY